MSNQGRIFQARTPAAGIAVTTQNDIIQMRNGTGETAEILAIQIFQTTETAIANAMNGLRLNRGAGGATGGTMTVRKMFVGDAASGMTVVSAPGTSVGTLDLDELAGWNVLQPFVWLPTPDFQIFLAASDHFGISLEITDTLTVRGSIWWKERDV